MAALRVWNAAPSTQQEVDDLLLKGQANLFTGTEPGLVAYYAFFEGFGNQLSDVTNNNQGSINGSLWSNGIAGGVGAVVSNEIRLFCPVFVDSNATGADDGSSWANAFDSIQEGVDAADEDGLMLVAEGTYGQGVAVLNTKPLTIKDGYPSGGGDQENDANPTILSGANINRMLRALHSTGTLFLEGLV